MAGTHEEKAIFWRHPMSAWILIVLLLGLWGTWAGPGWDPQPMKNSLIPETANTAILTRHSTPTPGTYQVRVTDAELTLPEGGTITVRIRTPHGTQSDVPGVVLLHGTGTASHADFAEHAEALASAGIATAVADKPLTTYSIEVRDYQELAEAYQEVSTYLRSLPGVQPQWVGYYGESEGALIAPIAAAADQQADFLVLVSDPVIPIREQGALAADAYLREIDAPAPLYRGIPRLISGALADGDTFQYANFDPSPYHRELTMPILMLYGTNDRSMPIVQGPLVLADQIATAGNDALLVRYYGGADHGLRVGGELLHEPFADVAAFINGLPESVEISPAIAGAQPRQDYTAHAIDSPRWFGSGDTMLTVLVTGVALTLVGIIIAVAGRVKIRGERLITYGGMGWPLVISGAITLLAWAVFIAYVLAVAHLALSYEHNRWIVTGGWLIVQLLGLAAVWALLRVVRLRHEDPPRKRMARASISLSFLGQALLIFSLAYWGIYPSIL